MSATQALPLIVIEHQIPAELKERPQWVAWKTITRTGKPTKVPINPDMGSHADTTTPSTWGPFGMARDRQRLNHLAGVGYVFSPLDPYCGIDLDDCRDPETRAIAPWARAILADLDSYAEASPSGTGVKAIIRATLPPHARHRAQIGEGELEIYDRARFFAMTGHRIPDAPAEIRHGQDALDRLYRRIFGDMESGDRTTITMPEINTDDPRGAALWQWAYPRLTVRMMRVANGDDTDYQGDASRGDAALILALRRLGLTDEETAASFCASPRGPALAQRKGSDRLTELVSRALESARGKIGEVARL